MQPLLIKNIITIIICLGVQVSACASEADSSTLLERARLFALRHDYAGALHALNSAPARDLPPWAVIAKASSLISSASYPQGAELLEGILSRSDLKGQEKMDGAIWYEIAHYNMTGQLSDGSFLDDSSRAALGKLDISGMYAAPQMINNETCEILFYPGVDSKLYAEKCLKVASNGLRHCRQIMNLDPSPVVPIRIVMRPGEGTAFSGFDRIFFFPESTEMGWLVFEIIHWYHGHDSWTDPTITEGIACHIMAAASDGRAGIQYHLDKARQLYPVSDVLKSKLPGSSTCTKPSGAVALSFVEYLLEIVGKESLLEMISYRGDPYAEHIGKSKDEVIEDFCEWMLKPDDAEKTPNDPAPLPIREPTPSP